MNGSEMFLIALVIVLAIMVVALWNNWLPFPDRDTVILTAKDDRSRDILTKLMEQHSGYNKFPRYVADDPNGKIKRDIYPGGFIFNVVDPDLLSMLGNAGSAIGIATHDPQTAAEEAVDYLNKNGDTAKLYGPFEEGKVFIVTTSFFVSSLLVFRFPIFTMGRPKKWSRKPASLFDDNVSAVSYDPK